MTTPSAPAPAAPRKVWPKLVLSLVPLAGIVWLMQTFDLKLVPPRAELARVAAGTLPIFIALWCVMYAVRLTRWSFLLTPVQRVPLPTVVRVGAVGLFAVALLPFRMGEVVRPLLIRREPRLTFWAASGTVGGERIIDALCVSVMLLVGLAVAKPQSPLPDHIGSLPIHVEIVPRMAMVSALVFASACIVMGVFYFARTWARALTERVIGLISPRLARWIASKIEQMAGGLAFLSEPRLAVPFVLLTVVYWLLNAATFWWLAVGCGVGSIGYWGAAAVMGVVALGILVPATPGFLGAFQFATYAGLAMYLTPEVVMTRGSAYAFLVWALPTGMTTLVGLVGIAARPSALVLLGTTENLPEQGAPG